jgi:hypothetical protein
MHRPGAIVVPDAHEPIVDRAVWEQANGRARAPRVLDPHLLTGLLWIGGSRCAGNVSKKQSYYADYRRTPGIPWLKVEDTDLVVWEAFTRLATTPEFVEPLIVKAKESRPAENLQVEIQRDEAQLKRQRERLSRLIDMRADAEIDKATYAAKSAEARGTIEQCERSIQELRSKLLRSDGRDAERVVRALRILLGSQTMLDKTQKRAVLHSAAKRIDASVVRNPVAKPRGARGRFLSGIYAAWKVRELRFHLHLSGSSHGGGSDTTSAAHGCPSSKVSRPDRARP